MNTGQRLEGEPRRWTLIGDEQGGTGRPAQPDFVVRGPAIPIDERVEVIEAAPIEAELAALREAAQTVLAETYSAGGSGAFTGVSTRALHRLRAALAASPASEQEGSARPGRPPALSLPEGEPDAGSEDTPLPERGRAMSAHHRVNVSERAYAVGPDRGAEAVREVDRRYVRFRPDGWPYCPNCGEDELYSLWPSTPEEVRYAAQMLPDCKRDLMIQRICGCYRCGPWPIVEPFAATLTESEGE